MGAVSQRHLLVMHGITDNAVACMLIHRRPIHRQPDLLGRDVCECFWLRSMHAVCPTFVTIKKLLKHFYLMSFYDVVMSAVLSFVSRH